ncbi:hypothetical protein I5M27_05615 [Adhaeribacter sp. BT258]|uniref:Uncharacterized protein n=1 Tax=Adhaeribacter terrigena TaxID=2793070 RepID=A0ABS1C1G2_9BACT|nr:hypothetical protein [Adhaeribacter terrigena]MBK0402453.1 hypothetical protein [Adhaeribacter terrigena]
MKTMLTLLLGFALISVTPLAAQDLQSQAEKETREMAGRMNLNEGEYLKIKKLNLERLEKIAALAQLREQDNRYLDLRLDQIEEQYAASIFNTLNTKQYSAFVEYRKEQPYTYAGLTMKNNTVAQTKE